MIKPIPWIPVQEGTICIRLLLYPWRWSSWWSLKTVLISTTMRPPSQFWRRLLSSVAHDNEETTTPRRMRMMMSLFMVAPLWSIVATSFGNPPESMNRSPEGRSECCHNCISQSWSRLPHGKWVDPFSFFPLPHLSSNQFFSLSKNLLLLLLYIFPKN